MTKLIKKAKSGIKFDSNQHYVNKHNKQFGKGIWYRDSNGNGSYDKGEQLIKPGNRIRNNDFSYSQLNSDGTITKLSDNKGNATKEMENKLSDADKYAMKHRLVYGRKASYNDNTKKWERNNNNPVQWDIDTQRTKNKKYTDIYNNTYQNYNLHNDAIISRTTNDGNFAENTGLIPEYNKVANLGLPNEGLPKETTNLLEKLFKEKQQVDRTTQIQSSQNKDTVWDLNPNGGSYTRGKYNLTYGQIDDGEGLNGSGYNDVDDAYRQAWLVVNPQAKGHGRWFWGHNAFKKDRILDISPEYVSQYENDLNNWLSKYYAINPAQNKSVFNADHKYLRKMFTQKDNKGNDVPYVPLFTGDQWGFGVRQYMDANGNISYKDYNGDDIPGLIMKNGKPYIPATPTGNYFKCGGKLIRKNKSGDRIVWDNSKRYVNSKGKQFGKGVWFFDKDGDGKYTKADRLIKPGNTIYNSDKTSVQLNSDGTMTKLFNLTGIYKNSNGTYSDKAQKVIGNIKTGLSKQAYVQLVKKSSKQTADFWNNNMKQGNYYIRQHWEDAKGNTISIIQHQNLSPDTLTTESTRVVRNNPKLHNNTDTSSNNKDSFWQILPNIFTYAKNYIIRRSHLATDSEQVANNKPTIKYNTEDINYTPTPINSAIKNRYIAPRFALLDTETFKPRNRGDYTPRAHSYADITATDPFVKVTGQLDPNVTYIGVDKNGHFKAGVGNDFTPGDYASRTYRNDISEFVDFTPDKQYSNRNRPTFRTTTGQIGSLNLLTTKNKQTNVYSDVSGGRVIFEPVKGKYYFVQGSIDDIRNSFNKLKKQYNVNHMQTYLLDNGSYSQGLRIKGNNLTTDILKQYDKLDTGGGNFLSENV